MLASSSVTKVVTRHRRRLFATALAQQAQSRLVQNPASITAITPKAKTPRRHHFSTFTVGDGSMFGFDVASGPAAPSPPGGPQRADLQRVSDGQSVSNAEESQAVHRQVIQRWMASNPEIAPYKAEEYLAKLWAEQQAAWKDRPHAPRPAQASAIIATDTVNLVLKAWCRSSHGQTAALRAERLLRWMEDLHSAPQQQQQQDAPAPSLPKPNYESYATAIEAWSRAAIHESKHHASPTAAAPRHSARHHISESTRAGFQCAKRAEDLLMHMQSMHEQQQQQQQDSSSTDLRPDTNVFHSVLRAWAHIQGGTKASATRAVRILDLMQELHHYQSLSDPHHPPKVRPHLQTYKLVLHAWAHAANAPEGPHRAEEILRHLLSMSKAGNVSQQDVLIDEECFRIVMKAHANWIRKASDSFERAQTITSLLGWMELLALRQPSSATATAAAATTTAVHPTTDSYRIALSAWAWSRHVDAPKQAERILFRMIRARDFSNVVHVGNNALAPTHDENPRVMLQTKDFNTVINCCAFARGIHTNNHIDYSNENDPLDTYEWTDEQLQQQYEIYLVAEGAFDALLSSPHVQPDSATFVGMIRACINLLPNTEERDARVIDLFRMAYRQNPPPPTNNDSSLGKNATLKPNAHRGGGCVDANVLRQLRMALPSTEEYIRVREEYEEFRRKRK